jgi:hypothetical protein
LKAGLGDASDPTHFGNRSIDRVIADEPSVPAAADEIVAREHGAVGVREGKQHLHNARFSSRASSGAYNGAYRRSDFGSAKAEIFFVS